LGLDKEIYNGGTEKKNVKKQDSHPQAVP